MLEANIFFEIGLIMVLATMFAYLARILNQPLIPAYVLAGLILGPFFHVIENEQVIHTLSEIGIAFLLFIVGLEIDIRKLWSVGPVSIMGGLTQMVAVFGVTFIAMGAFGFSSLTATYLGIVAALSSTMVVIKLLSDKKEIDTLHGRIVLGILLVQDIAAIIALFILGTLGNLSVTSFVLQLANGIIVFILAVLAGRYILPKLFHYAARNQELLFVSTIAIAFSFAIVFSKIGFSVAIGAFVAGVILASLPYAPGMVGKIKPLRDFFAVMFFVSLGMQLVITTLWDFLFPLVVLSIIVIIFKPIILMFLTSFYGYKKHTAFMAGISLAQVSEFSLIIATLGLLSGHITEEIFSMTIIMAVFTILTTSYFMQFSERFFSRFGKHFHFLDKFSPDSTSLELKAKKRPKNHIVLCGHNRIGHSIVNKLKTMKKPLFVIDYNPEVIKHLVKQKVPCVYGDIEDEEVLERANLENASMLISTVPLRQESMMLIHKAKTLHPNIVVFVTANDIDTALDLYKEGADYVILPHLLGGEHVSFLLEDFKANLPNILDAKGKHIDQLRQHTGGFTRYSRMHND